jgi:biotin synthase-like enzyme
VPYHTLVRTIATARIVLPTSIIRLAAGRNTLAESEQAMCFMAGANAVFTGEQMLTTPCEFATSLKFWILNIMSRFAMGRGKYRFVKTLFVI